MLAKESMYARVKTEKRDEIPRTLSKISFHDGSHTIITSPTWGMLAKVCRLYVAKARPCRGKYCLGMEAPLCACAYDVE